MLVLRACAHARASALCRSPILPNVTKRPVFGCGMECSHWSNTLDSEGQTCLDSMDCLVWARPRPCVSYFLVTQIATGTFGLSLLFQLILGIRENLFSTAGSMRGWKSGCTDEQISPSSSVIVSSSNSVASAKSHFLHHKHSPSDAIGTQRPQVPHQANLLSCDA